MYNLVIVGGGPAGISLAAEAMEAGFDRDKVVILEKASKESWIIRKLYPEQKLVTANYKGQSPVSNGIMKFHDMNKEATVKVLKDTIKEYDANIQYDKNVSMIEYVDGIFHLTVNGEIIKTKSCAIAIGVFGKPRKPDYKIPRAIKKQTSFDITSSVIEDCEVLVVGGGDSASEYVQHLHKKNNKLTMSVREEKFQYMNDDNQKIIADMEKSGDVKLLMGNTIETIEEQNNRILAHFYENTPDVMEFDRVVYALGGTTPINFLKVIGIDFNEGVPALTESYETSIKGLYLIGDLGSGKKGGAIIHAFNSSYAAMKDIKGKYKD